MSRCTRNEGQQTLQPPGHPEPGPDREEVPRMGEGVTHLPINAGARVFSTGGRFLPQGIPGKAWGIVCVITPRGMEKATGTSGQKPNMGKASSNAEGSFRKSWNVGRDTVRPKAKTVSHLRQRPLCALVHATKVPWVELDT